MFIEDLGIKPMRDTRTLNEEWLERTKRLRERSISETDITKSKSLWVIASFSESIRWEWLEQTRDAGFVI